MADIRKERRPRIVFPCGFRIVGTQSALSVIEAGEHVINRATTTTSPRRRVATRRAQERIARRERAGTRGEQALAAAPEARPSKRAVRRSGALLLAGDTAALLLGVALTGPLTAASWVYLGAALALLAMFSAYRLRISLSALDDAPRFAGALAVALLPVALVPAANRTVLVQAVASIALIVVGRGFTYAGIRALRRHGLTERTLIAGSGYVGIELAHLLRAHPEYGLEPVAFVGAPFPNLPAPLIGDIAHLDEVVTRNAIRRVLVAFGPTREAELVGVLRTAVLRDVEVHVVPRFFEVGVAPRGPDVDDIWGIPVYRVRQAALRAQAWRFKRALDVVVAAGMLLVTAPVMLSAAILVKLSSPGPTLFRQYRIGQYGQEIEVLKFRTLPADHVDSCWNASEGEYHNRAGRLLRRLSIDELPQLWNVLRGDMSLVGPRPERGYLVEQFSTSVYGYRDRHRLPVGLTGWAQVHGLRGETSLRERVRFDNQYIEHWSLWRDVVILVRTATAFFRSPHRASMPDPLAPRAGSDGSGGERDDDRERGADAWHDTGADSPYA